jgi:hypothetical protein
MITWTKSVAKEWRYLFKKSNIISISNKESFDEIVLASEDFVIVAYLDGLDCSSCKTAKTNIMRLSAGLLGYDGITIALVDCESQDSKFLCYQDQNLPSRPHAPIVKGYPSGTKSEVSKGEILYNSNELEPHLAMEIMERIVRLALSDRIQNSQALSEGNDKSEYDKDKEDDDENPPKPTETMWNGPPPRAPISWGGNGGGGGGGQRHAIGR